jgi:hypothetical protein
LITFMFEHQSFNVSTQFQPCDYYQIVLNKHMRKDS